MISLWTRPSRSSCSRRPLAAPALRAPSLSASIGKDLPKVHPKGVASSQAWQAPAQFSGTLARQRVERPQRAGRVALLELQHGEAMPEEAVPVEASVHEVLWGLTPAEPLLPNHPFLSQVQPLLKMTSSAAFRCVQAWLLEKPAAWVDEDAPCLAAALMAQRPPCDMLRKRPREDALLEAERSHQRHIIAQLDEELLDETLHSEERERDNKNLRWMLERKNEYLRQTRKRALQAERRVAELERNNIRQRVECLGEILE